jgi:hypothetical protein
MTSSLSAGTNAIFKWSQEHLRTYAHVVLDRREVRLRRAHACPSGGTRVARGAQERAD